MKSFSAKDEYRDNDDKANIIYEYFIYQIIPGMKIYVLVCLNSKLQFGLCSIR